MKRVTFALVAVAIAGCGPDQPSDTGQDTGSDAQDTTTTTDTEVDTDVSTEGLEVTFWAPPEVVSGIPFVVRVDASEGGRPITGSLALEGADATVWLERGRGTAVVTLDAPTTLTAGEVSREVFASELQVEAGGELAEVNGWNGKVHVTSDLTVPEGGTLSIQAGSFVTVDPGVNLFVHGELRVLGEVDSPVSFVAAGDAPWGGIIVSGSAELSHALLSGGGGDEGRHFGHSNSQPVIFSDGGTVTMHATTLSDAPGKAMGAVGGTWTIDESVIARCDTGGEFERVALTIEDTHFMHFPERDPSPRDDDNDAIYILGDPNWADQPLARLDRVTFVDGADDGIDHNGSRVHLTGSWIEGFDNECIAASSGGEMRVEDTYLAGCEQGLEAGYGAPEVIGRHLLIRECEVGVRFGDNYTRDYDGHIDVQGSVIYGHSRYSVWNWDLGIEAPHEGVIAISGSVLDDDRDIDGSLNTIGTPVLADDLTLSPDSPGWVEGDDRPGLVTPRAR